MLKIWEKLSTASKKINLKSESDLNIDFHKKLKS